ncbi:MAG: M23 family metallopeptidase [Crocinitomicaceae bacterium]|nr:M23 family metallopeptidase [Crocinitomicaceae bacterium]
MSTSERLKSFLERIREKHKLHFTDDTTYHDKWSFRLSVLNLWTLLGLYTVLIIVGLSLLIKYTGVRDVFIDVPPVYSVTQINSNSERIDSLMSATRSRQKYLDDLKRILLDQPFLDSMKAADDSLFVNYNAHFTKSKEDSILRIKVENDGKETAAESEFDFFTAPVRGTISKSFNTKKGHYGVDVVTENESPIKSCLDGTVIFSSWTPDDGNVIILQHSNDFISVYKHCSSLLKVLGDKVQIADPVAIVGNTGKHTSGPHLHFELWQKGIPLDPQEFINFKK